jgi:hypothetical protein
MLDAPWELRAILRVRRQCIRRSQMVAACLSLWKNEGMPKHPKRPRDLNEWAKRMTDLATGMVQEPEMPKESAAAELGRRGGLIGGKVRAKGMTAKQRSASARKAAKARWGK